jgi:hypothetical protein
VTLRQDDGSGAEYQHPSAASRGYFQLPHAYWLDGWCDRLDLAAKAVLLILLSRLPDSELPQERAASWYGISSDTLLRGLQSLNTHQLLATRTLKKAAPFSPIGFSWEKRYTLLAPFEPPPPRPKPKRDAAPVAKGKRNGKAPGREARKT